MEEKRNGFTLIELLAVIVILAIIALIAVPVIMNIISKANKSAFKDSAYGVVKAGELYYSEKLLNVEGIQEDISFVFPEAEGLELKGSRPTSGTMKVTKEGKVAIAISNGKYCAKKGFNETDVTIDEDVENCLIPIEATGITLSTKNLTVEKDKTETVTATLTPTTVTNKTINWKSNNESIVTVSNGVITGVGVGTATITVTSGDGNVSDTINVTVKEKVLTSTNNCINSNSVCPNGTKVNVKVNDTENYDFYVIKDTGTELTLIMARNLGSKVAWITKADYVAAGGTENDYPNNINKGPLTAIAALEMRTAGWTNIEAFNYTYTDDGGANKYSGIIRNNIRARLLTYTEAKSLGCVYQSNNSCPTYLYENLSSSNTEEFPSGYWLSAVSSYLSYCSLTVNVYGNVNDGNVSFDSYQGVRPVIKISKSI